MKIDNARAWLAGAFHCEYREYIEKRLAGDFSCALVDLFERKDAQILALEADLRALMGASPATPAVKANKAQPEVAENTGSHAMANQLQRQGLTVSAEVDGAATPGEASDADDRKCEAPNCGCADAFCKAWPDQDDFAAPTVKAEQVAERWSNVRVTNVKILSGRPEQQAEYLRELGLPAPSLPAAGSAVDRVVATAPERIYLIIGDDCPRDVDFSELGEVAWCEEEAAQGIEYVRAALSAQQSAQDDEYPPCDYCRRELVYHPWHGSGLFQGVESRHIHACDECRHLLPSAPERVSVPRDLLADLISSDHDTRIQAERALYALLASHGRGEA